MSMSRLRDYQGPALFSYGFRPFFFFGSVYAGAIILVWLPAFYGQLKLSTAFAPRDWHVHEMLFGYIAAVVAGFLLTAVPNWTGRLPLQGRPLILLFSTWVAGRIAVSVSAWIGWGPAASIDCVFLILLAASAAREIIAGKKWGNLMIVAIISLLAAGNLAFHLEAHFTGLAEYTTRAGIAVVISTDRFDRRPDHPELYPQLAGEADAGSDAGAVRPLRCRDRRRERAGAPALG